MPATTPSPEPIDLPIDPAPDERQDDERQALIDLATVRLTELKAICDVINLQRNSVLSVEGDGKSHLVLAYLLLGIKSAGSGFFRFFILRHLMLLLQQEPFVHETNWSQSPVFTEAAPLVFATADLFMTFFGSKHSVLEFCKHLKSHSTLENTKTKLMAAAKTAWQHPLLSLLVPFGLFTAEWKAAIGTEAELNRLAKFVNAPHYVSVIFLCIAHLFGVINAFIYFAFKIDDQAIKNLKIKAALRDDPYWKNFYLQNRGFIYRQYAMSVTTSLLTTAVVGMTAFYSNARNAFEFSWMHVALFCILVLPETALSLWFTVNPDIFYTEIKVLYKKLRAEAVEQRIEIVIAPSAEDLVAASAPVSANTSWILRPLLRIGGCVSSVGTGLSLLPQFIYLSMMMRNDKSLSNQRLNECLLVLTAALACALLLGYRDYSYWTKKTGQRVEDASLPPNTSTDPLSPHAHAKNNG